MHTHVFSSSQHDDPTSSCFSFLLFFFAFIFLLSFFHLDFAMSKVSNQYSVTEHLRHINPGSGRGLPGVWFFYEVAPSFTPIHPLSSSSLMSQTLCNALPPSLLWQTTTYLSSSHQVSPVHALFEETRRSSLLEFTSSVCAILGGVFTILGVIDGGVGAVARRYFGRAELGI